MKKAQWGWPATAMVAGAIDTVQNKVPDNYGEDVDFLHKFVTICELVAPDDTDAKIVIVPAYQGRVMTSTLSGNSGQSFGWINYDHIRSRKTVAHMNAYGGEERFWLSPEGGQFSIYFSKGDPFDLTHWQTPSVIDTEAYDLVSKNEHQAIFKKRASLANYQGVKFDIEIERKVAVLSANAIADHLDIKIPKSISLVAYASENSITNVGEDWNRDMGTLGIWILGMYNPSDYTTLIAPYEEDHDLELTDDYFGKVPEDRLQIRDGVILFKGDGKHRSKIGLTPASAKNVAGAWDSQSGTLTLIQYDVNPEGEYLSSTWEIHENPFSGDAFNAYNDGPTDNGSQLGPFVELESNSYTSALKKGEKLTHNHRTVHLQGDRDDLNAICETVLGISISAIEETFK